MLTLHPFPGYISPTQQRFGSKFRSGSGASIDFYNAKYMAKISTVHGVITVCMLRYYNNMLLQASNVFVDPMKSCP